VVSVDDLRSIPLFAHLSDELAQRLASRGADVRVPAGETFVHEGESVPVFALLAGSFAIEKRYAGEHRLLATRVPGDTLGEIPLLLGTPSFVSARALEPLRLIRIDASEFRHLIASDADVRRAILDIAATRLAGIQEEALVESRFPIVIGANDDLACHDLREFLALNRETFEWVEPTDAVGKFPQVIVPAETGDITLVQPSQRELAQALNLQTLPRGERYDVAIVGGGPAGLAAAVYGASEGLATILIERRATGGQAGTSSRIENYLGFPSGVSGDELAARAHHQARRFGAELLVAREARALETGPAGHRVIFEDGTVVDAAAVVLASGVSYRALETEGIGRFVGSGVFYGASRSEAPSVAGRDIVLIGGGNSAGQAAMYFSSYAARVTLLVRGEGLAASMSQYLIDELASRENVSVRTRSEAVAFLGESRLEALRIRDREKGVQSDLPAQAVFVFIGADAQTEWLPATVVRDKDGFVCTGRDVRDLARDGAGWPLARDPYLLETSVPGLFAAGDVRHGSIKRVAAGVGEGSTAIAFVHQYLAERQS
jgi:thioredoxin reductase (NADPH)